ncbi:5317_t:CDS:2 [Dentiscutata heterogama]|uniref:5317_t:CDS:1 n=1 Tax=Dentiscutata heterogama TaxID=1316150 RepID=A0ACA9N0I6_9GLOM|nr:5317_t:CDS:2 [Dentiscutata heterogama]
MKKTLKYHKLDKIRKKEFANKEFSRALEKLKEVDSNYTKKPLETSFNWNEIAADIKDVKGEWYFVAFQSIGSVNANFDLLSDAKKRAYHKAENHEGLLKYWSGEFNQNQECLSTCIWASRDNAVEASEKCQYTFAKKLANAIMKPMC